MYLEHIELKFIEPCTTTGNKIKIITELSRDVSDIFPYLNTHIKSAMYNKTALTFSFKLGQKLITLFPNRLTITKLLNETDAYEMMDYVQNLINEVDANRDNIIPSDNMRKPPSPIEIYKNLPKSNCKKCEEITCMAFASKLLSGEKSIKRCEPLYEEVNLEKLENLETMMMLLGYEV
ncbi:(Fe-S)-binding protein [Romboutsia sp.]|uniref:(Fe-S)-binding protein n=1 Tax=Romboutsia sp. TaxID=1965302 RepID=UPI003F2BEEB4